MLLILNFLQLSQFGALLQLSQFGALLQLSQFGMQFVMGRLFDNLLSKLLRRGGNSRDKIHRPNVA
jgi:hypothetical protein